MTTTDEPSRREMRDRQAARILESSVLIRFAERALVQMARATEASSVAASARRSVAAWNQLPGGQRRFLTGVLCVTAALANFVVTIAGKTPPGWLWMVPPAIVMAIGATLMLAAASHESREAS